MDNSSKHTNPNSKGSLHRTASQFGSLTREIEEAVREVEAVAREAISEFSGFAKNTVGEAQASITKKHTEPVLKPYTPVQKKAKRTKLDRKTGKAASVLLTMLAIMLLLIGTAGLYTTTNAIWNEGISRWPDLILVAFFGIGGFTCLLTRNTVAKRYTRYRMYYSHIEGRDIVQIENISRISGYSVRKVKRDLQAMINHGYLKRGTYIDSGLGILVLCEDAAETARRNAGVSSQLQEPPAPAAAYENQYMATLTELRELKSSIADVNILAKVDRIEELTANIFRAVEEAPEKEPQIRRFTSYYLPTTFKLLRSYATLEKQGVKGENITATKESIGRVLDSLSTGYEQQLDLLFRSDAIDIASDISVLENLMQQDGLTNEKTGFMTMEGTG